mmetsp:Transcript_36757/g.118216  ORF Transcript_36757/g.118216 Transcript_36757/m.118216 type:complete len:214 (+) Transcript_36757:2447-3088(+)
MVRASDPPAGGRRLPRPSQRCAGVLGRAVATFLRGGSCRDQDARAHRGLRQEAAQAPGRARCRFRRDGRYAQAQAGEQEGALSGRRCGRFGIGARYGRGSGRGRLGCTARAGGLVAVARQYNWLLGAAAVQGVLEPRLPIRDARGRSACNVQADGHIWRLLRGAADAPLHATGEGARAGRPGHHRRGTRRFGCPSPQPTRAVDRPAIRPASGS